MKAELGAVVKIRPRQGFDTGINLWCEGLPGTDSCIRIDADHVATVAVAGHVVMRIAVCAEHAGILQSGVEWTGFGRRPLERRARR